MNTITNSKLAEMFNVKIADNGFHAIDERGRRLFLTDLRQQAIKTLKKNANKKPRTINKTPLPTADENLHRLNADFTEHQWFIRETQPGLEVEELGLRFYFIGGATNHQLSISSTLLSATDLRNLYANKKILNSHKGKESITIGSLSYDEVIEITQDVISKCKNMA